MKSQNISCVFLNSNLKQMAPNRRPSGIRKNLINAPGVYSKHYGKYVILYEII